MILKKLIFLSVFLEQFSNLSAKHHQRIFCCAHTKKTASCLADESDRCRWAKPNSIRII